MNWYIGQEIVCVKSHSQGAVTKGKTYTIKGLKEAPCTCKTIKIDVGINDGIKAIEHCSVCKRKEKPLIGPWWLHESSFVPTEYNTETIKTLMEEPIPLENIIFI